MARGKIGVLQIAYARTTKEGTVHILEKYTFICLAVYQDFVMYSTFKVVNAPSIHNKFLRNTLVLAYTRTASCAISLHVRESRVITCILCRWGA